MMSKLQKIRNEQSTDDEVSWGWAKKGDLKEIYLLTLRLPHLEQSSGPLEPRGRILPCINKERKTCTLEKASSTGYFTLR